MSHLYQLIISHLLMFGKPLIPQEPGGVLTSISNDIDKVLGEDEGHSFSSNTQLFLKISQDVGEVDVDQLKKKTRQTNTCTHAWNNSLHARF